jgi:hypothetical protein
MHQTASLTYCAPALTPKYAIGNKNITHSLACSLSSLLLILHSSHIAVSSMYTRHETSSHYMPEVVVSTAFSLDVHSSDSWSSADSVSVGWFKWCLCVGLQVHNPSASGWCAIWEHVCVSLSNSGCLKMKLSDRTQIWCVCKVQCSLNSQQSISYCILLFEYALQEYPSLPLTAPVRPESSLVLTEVLFPIYTHSTLLSGQILSPLVCGSIRWQHCSTQPQQKDKQHFCHGIESFTRLK